MSALPEIKSRMARMRIGAALLVLIMAPASQAELPEPGLNRREVEGLSQAFAYPVSAHFCLKPDRDRQQTTYSPGARVLQANGDWIECRKVFLTLDGRRTFMAWHPLY